MKDEFPEMTSHSTILLGPVESRIREIDDKKISLTFTMAVLMHIHPSSHFIFSELSRVTNDYLLTIEREFEYGPPYNFPRDYGKIFTGLGWRQIKSQWIEEDCFTFHGSKDSFLRVFSKQ